MLKRWLTAGLTVALLLGAAGPAAYAAEMPDLSREGSITLTMTYDSKTVAGGEMTLYRVGDIQEDDGSYYFTLADEFVGSEADLTDVSSSDLASALSAYASAQSLTGTTKTIGNDGTVTFESLTLGLYLMVQNKAASGYYAAEPFLVSVPMYDEANAVYEYAVTATPKVELSKRSFGGGGSSHGGGSSSSGGSSSPGGNSGSSGGSSSEGGPGVSTGNSNSEPSGVLFPMEPDRLPQTGQLNWPVPVLTLCGLLLFVIGWKLFFGGKNHLEQEA